MGNPIVHFEVRVNDESRQPAFYEQLFGWKLGGEDPLLSYRMVDTQSDAGIQGGMLPAGSGLTPGLTVYAQVDDLSGAIDRAQSLGASTVVPPTKLPGPGSFAVIADPAGYQIGLLQY